jgi:hypothetical protein
MGALRRRAVSSGVTIDAWLNVAMARRFIDDVPPLEQEMSRMRIREPANRRLRAWQRYLEEQDGPAPIDELPEVVVSRDAIDDGAARWLDAPELLELTDLEWDLARRCEIRAVGLGMSLQKFVLAATAHVL